MKLGSPDLLRIPLPCATQNYCPIQARYCIGIRLAIIVHEQFVVTALYDNGLAPDHLEVLILNILKFERPQSRGINQNVMTEFACV